MDRSSSSSSSPDVARPRISRGLKVLGPAALLLCHAPLAYFALWKISKVLFGVAMMLVFLSALIGPTVKSKLPRLFALWAIFYYLGVAIGQAIPTFFLLLISKAFTAVLAMLALCSGAVAGRRRASLIAGSALLLSAIAIAIPLRPGQIILIVVAGSIAFLIGHYGGFSEAPRRMRMAAVYGILGSLKLACFLSGIPWWQMDDILAQPGMRPIYLASDDHASAYEYIGQGSEARFMAYLPDGRGALVGIRGRNHGLLLIDRSDLRVLRYIPFDGDCSDNAAIDVLKGRIFVSDYGSGILYRLSLDSLQVQRKASSPAGLPGLWRMGVDGGRLLLLHDADPDVYSIDPESLEATGKVSLGRNAALVLDEALGLAWHISDTGRLTAIDLGTLAPRSSSKLPGFSYFNMAFEPAEPALYVTSMGAGKVFVLDPTSLEIKRSAVLAQGIRHVVVLPGGLLAISNFVRGDVLFLDSRTLAVLHRMKIGPRPRWLEYDPAGGLLLATSASGAFEIDLSKMELAQKK